ncbi:MAG: IMP dehydrogenase, partial [Candidatus Oxydemutatoraceae bacterium WSBS_2016_MAG_OTU14]
MEKIQEALTFDDVLIVPAYSEVLPADVDLTTHLTRSICLNVPLASSAMDTVTEENLAIALAQAGGIGFIHKNMSIADQHDRVALVKRYESGVIKNPITVNPHTSIREVVELTERHKISGVPVVDKDGLCGIVTHRDLRFETRLGDSVSTVMTPKDKLITVREGEDRKKVQSLLHKHRIEKVLVINDDFELCGMITAKDFQKSSEYPQANKDDHERLRVGAAVGIGRGSMERVEALLSAEVDVIAIDTAHGHSKLVLDTVRAVKKTYPDLQVIAGNIVSSEGAKALADCGVDGVKVGIGPGSICTTRIIAGIGVPQITAIQQVAQGLKGTGIPLIADGGVRFSGDIAKAIVAGAHTVMIGSLFAGTYEAPGEVELYQGRSYKVYRGMGTIAAMNKGSSDRYFQHSTQQSKLVPEGIEGRVPY